METHAEKLLMTLDALKTIKHSHIEFSPAMEKEFNRLSTLEPIIRAYIAGEKVQFFDTYTEKWHVIEVPEFSSTPAELYRIKPKGVPGSELKAGKDYRVVNCPERALIPKGVNLRTYELLLDFYGIELRKVVIFYNDKAFIAENMAPHYLFELL